jgi:two-component system, cell cycle response regulator
MHEPDPHTRPISSITLDLARRARVPRAPQPASLVQYSGAALGRRYVLRAGLMQVGRVAQNDLVIADESVSRNHARLFVRDDIVEVEDSGGVNGTRVNGKRIVEMAALHDGDIVEFGSVHFKFFGSNSVESVFHDEMFRRATEDVLTGAFNRAALEDALGTVFSACRTQGGTLSVIFFDLDHFKTVNDTHGHGFGDVVLRQVAQTVRDVLREGDTLGRIGGEEFVVVLPECPLAQAAELAERIRMAVMGLVVTHEGVSISVTVSSGVAQMLPEMETPQALVAAADALLYSAKESGRNRVTVAKP